MGSFSRSAQFLAGKALESALFIVHDCQLQLTRLKHNLRWEEFSRKPPKRFFYIQLRHIVVEKKETRQLCHNCEMFHPSGLTRRKSWEKILKDFQFAQIPKISCCWGRRCRNPCKTKVRPKSGCSRQKDGRWLEKFSVIGKDSMDCVLTSR